MDITGPGDDVTPGAFSVRWDDASPWPAVQTLNRRRARQFLLAVSESTVTAHGEQAFHDGLLARGHGLAFYTRIAYGRREFACRHYGGPEPRLLPAVPPDLLPEPWSEPWRLVATYRGPELFDEDWAERVSALPLESFLTVHVDGEGERGLRVSDRTLELVRIGTDGERTVTALGRLRAKDDPLAVALRAVPDLLAFDPYAAVDITADTPFAVADAIRFSADLDRADAEARVDEEFFADEEESLLEILDGNLVPVMFRINGVPHFAARADGEWVLVPVERLYRFPSPVTNRTFISVSFDYDGGGYSSGGGFETIAEIRPGLNIAWEDYSDEAWDREMTLSREPLPEFAAGHLPYRFSDRIIAVALGGEYRFPDDLWGHECEESEVETNLGDDEKWYVVETPQLGFERHDPEGVRFLAALGLSPDAAGITVSRPDPGR
ncbi:hypothetical protein AAH991_33315 [Microbispora sp. ZYX-F-249]|uniref:Uncharacterized protein n=1 Tax=Microbispora maris TaxID=3144104 RepID=A0ABV0B245_9ACTN